MPVVENTSIASRTTTTGDPDVDGVSRYWSTFSWVNMVSYNAFISIGKMDSSQFQQKLVNPWKRLQN